jgi:type IV pilus assembly protein PilB
MSNSDNRLGELLLRSSLINQGQLQRARQAQQQQGGRLGYHLTKLGFVKEPDLTSFLSKQHGVPSIKLSELTEVDPAILQLIPREVAERNLAFPVSRAGQSLIVAMVDPSNLAAIDDLKFRTGYSIEVVVTSEQGLREAIEVHYRPETNYDDIFNDFALDEVTFSEDGEEMESANELQNAAEEAPVVRLVNAILVDAIRRGASDIHIEPYEKSFRVRYRVDGVLNESMNPPLKLRNALTSRLKIMSNLDIAERRLPQDGRIKLKLGKGQEMDFRVSVLPTLFGEKIVLRLLDKSNLQLDMTKLGFDPKPLANFQKAIHLPYGMCLVTGPTGSGKTTTLYSALSELNKSTENISTAEDPVEFNLAGINQVQIQDGIGLNFAAALRSFLRQDPDIIMVGEIRDFETAEIAIQGLAHRSPRTLDPAHQRRARRHQPPPRDGHRARPRLLRRVTARARPAPRPQGLQRLRRADQGRARGLARDPSPRGQDRHRQDLQRQGLPHLRRLWLQRPRRPLRGHGHGRRPARRRPAGPVHLRAQGPRHPPRHADPAHGRKRQAH